MKLVYDYRGQNEGMQVQERALLRRFMQFVMNLPWWAWNNKLKTALIIIVLYAARKAYCLYRDWIKPFLELANPSVPN